jgi:integrase
MNEVRVTVVDYGRKNLMLRYVDPITGKQKHKSAGTARKSEAVKAAGKWEAELREGRYAAPCRTAWPDFRDRYESEVLPRLAPRTSEPREAVMNHVERILSPRRVGDLTADRLSYFESELRRARKDGDDVIPGLKDSTIAGHLAHLRSILSWAVEIGALRAVPKIQKPTRNVGGKAMRGRPITAEEFDRMLAKVEAALLSLNVPTKPSKREISEERRAKRHERRLKLVAARADAWRHYLNGLWLSGLRLEESLKLSWDADAEIMVDLSSRYPRLRIYAEAEKGHRDRLLPMTPDFAEWLLTTPQEQRHGPVFTLGLAPKTVSRIVSAIGEKAGVVVNKAEGKFASAHDLRRAFGTRWASKVKPATLQLLMRHASIQTTLDYYVSMDADDVAGELWAAHDSSTHLRTMEQACLP